MFVTKEYINAVPNNRVSTDMKASYIQLILLAFLLVNIYIRIANTYMNVTSFLYLLLNKKKEKGESNAYTVC